MIRPVFRKSLLICYICALAYICVFIASFLEVYLVSYYYQTLERENGYPQCYLSSQMYSIENLDYDSFNDRLCEFIRANPSLTKDYKDTITNRKYMECFPESKRVSVCLYLEESHCFLDFLAFQSKDGMNVSLMGKALSWSKYDETYQFLMPAYRSELSLSENLTLCDTFEKNVLSHIGTYKKDKVQGFLVWYYNFCLSSPIIFISLFVLSFCFCCGIRFFKIAI